MVTINFEETYPSITVASDISHMTFASPQVDGRNQLLLVKISPHNDPFLPQVYNLGFGPPNEQGGFDDNVRLKHKDINKVLSTVLFHGLTFLKQNRNLILGVDGSDDLRAAMYHMMVKTNRAYLEDYFAVIGVDWYVRVFRNWQCEVDALGNLFAKPKPEPFDYHRNRHNLYRYYMFELA